MNIYLETYGCTSNRSDESLILGILKKRKYRIVDHIDKADVLVLLTCTVIDTTAQRMLSRLKKFKKTGKKIIVAGCMSSVQPDLVKSVVPNAALLPTQYIHHIDDVIKRDKVNFVTRNKTLLPRYFKNITAPISIAEGCTFSCSYCIAHVARGELRSYPIDEIISDVCFALHEGCKEIQITAQDTASYGLDIGTNLGELLSRICKIEKDFRIRVGMMNPYTAQMNLENILSAYENTKIYKFIHLPVQSGDDDILKKMNRKYRVEDFLKIIDDIRRKHPDMTLSTDIIVGFPTETDEQFQHTIDLLKAVKPDIVNITRYSPRPLTKAKNMEGHVSTQVSKERSKSLSELTNKISEEKNKKHIGRKYHVLVTEEGKNKTFVGRSENYKPVVIREKTEIGKTIPVKIVDSTPTYLFGKLI
jgi:MiaB-like tRNA modifying enzyme